MTDPDPDTTARNRYFVIVAARMAATAGAVFGVVLLGRAQTLYPQILALAIIISALVVMAVVPRALAQRWRTPPAP